MHINRHVLYIDRDQLTIKLKADAQGNDDGIYCYCPWELTQKHPHLTITQCNGCKAIINIVRLNVNLCTVALAYCVGQTQHIIGHIKSRDSQSSKTAMSCRNHAWTTILNIAVEYITLVNWCKVRTCRRRDHIWVPRISYQIFNTVVDNCPAYLTYIYRSALEHSWK